MAIGHERPHRWLTIVFTGDVEWAGQAVRHPARSTRYPAGTRNIWSTPRDRRAAGYNWCGAGAGDRTRMTEVEGF